MLSLQRTARPRNTALPDSSTAPCSCPGLFDEASRLKVEKKYTKSIETYLEVLSADPSYKEAAYNIGNIYRVKDRMDLAVTYWKQALDIDPSFQGAHINLGIALRATGNLDEAIYHYMKVIETDQGANCVEAYVNLGKPHLPETPPACTVLFFLPVPTPTLTPTLLCGTSRCGPCSPQCTRGQPKGGGYVQQGHQPQ